MNVVVFDLETTGLSPERDGIVEIGAVRIVDGQVDETQRYETLVRPTTAGGDAMLIPWRAEQVHGISNAMVRAAPTIQEVLPEFLEFVNGWPVVAHNIGFDAGFMRANAARSGLNWNPQAEYCTVQLSRRAFPKERAHNLTVLAERLGLNFAPGGRHRSFGDVQVTAQAYLRLMELLRQKQT
ncbi:3'-5' exonuclease [Deinococcus radiotolerans]|uniref:DNA polymerase III subunit epsilon n=1 Tax=Deinococcus radiotolerans TaxID=1309407 RepID=A0ABQ2FGN1_9DEIO|nr:3'-5' exonuclease [Deinococcus radiotolerans]GGK92642.1 DNA polymerase III subunit epsilon [Deinococcus radiotolerans]